MAKAHRLFHQRVDFADGAILEMVVWRVETAVPPSTHDLKYSLFYGRPGLREVGYSSNMYQFGDTAMVPKPLTNDLSL